MNIKPLIGGLSLMVASVFSASASAAIDPTLPEYQKTSGVSGNLSSVGSDTLANMMTLWAEEFRKQYPNINPQIQAAGSSTAPPALTEGTSQFGPMSRKMKPNEEEAFVKRFGYKPTAIRVAIDALAVFVHKDNPIEGLTIEQVDGVFSSTLKCGGDAVRRWGDLGLSGSWSSRDIQLYGRNSVSGTYGYFKKKALCKGDFKPNVNEQPGSASVVQSVSTSLNAIGYSGIGYQTAGVRAVPLGKSGNEFVEATAANAANGQYPLSRYLYVYVNKHPNRPLDPMVAEFIKFMLSKEGQQIVDKDGYVPLPRAVIARDLERLGIQL
ncbi:phosphate ABC transporter substrate-binding protein PstS family protein [Marinobacter hydrocarbonoclasticus]|nr:phosphate ABC transporter substrate-binding protein PstS family protein [Marinobacter nauticus]